MHHKIAVIIVTWNSQEYICSCLDSLKHGCGRYPYEVIICDNASSDRTVAVVKERYPDVTLIENKKNIGFAAGNNTAYRHVSDDANLVLVLNPDTKVIDNAIEILADYLVSDKDIGVCSPLLLNEDGSVQRSTGGRFLSIRRVFNEMFFLTRINPGLFEGLYTTETEKVLDIDWVSGACMLIRRDVIDKVGFFDESYFMYGEDTELCMRIRDIGEKVIYLPQAKVFHYQGKSLVQQEEGFFSSFDSGFFRLLESRLARWQVIIIKYLFLVGFWLRLSIHFFCWKVFGNKKAEKKFRVIKSLKKAHFAVRRKNKIARLNKYLRLAIGMINGRQAYTGPLIVQIGLSNRCNYRCQMCWDHPPFRTKDKSFFPDRVTQQYYSENKDVDLDTALMDFSIYKELISDLVTLNVEKVKFIGRGEPFVNPHAVDMIAYASSKGLKCDISTNGSLLTREIIDKLIEIDNLLHIQVSLNAANNLSYKKIHNLKSDKLFFKIIDNLQYLRDRKYNSISTDSHAIQLSMVVCKYNFRDILDMVKLARELDAESLFLREMAVYRQIENLLLSDDEEKEFLDILDRAIDEIERIGIHNNFKVFKRIRTQKSFVNGDMFKWLYSKISCYAGWYYSVILADGTVNPCCECLKVMGNIKKDRFYKIWYSNSYNEFRQIIRNFPKTKKIPLGCKCYVCGLGNYNIAIDKVLYPFVSRAPITDLPFSIKDFKHFYME